MEHDFSVRTTRKFPTKKVVPFSRWKFSDEAACSIYEFRKDYCQFRIQAAHDHIFGKAIWRLLTSNLSHTKRITSELAMNHANTKTCYQRELEAFQTRVVEELFLCLVLLGTELQRSLKSCRQKVFIKTFIFTVSTRAVIGQFCGQYLTVRLANFENFFFRTPD